MMIVIGSDHVGFLQKYHLRPFLAELCNKMQDVRTYSTEPGLSRLRRG